LNIRDTLNEWSDETLGDFILDGEDPVVIRRELIAKEKGFLDIFNGSVAWDVEFASHEVKHRQQVFGGSIATGFSLCSREQTI
jgi:hypothetical protein